MTLDMIIVQYDYSPMNLESRIIHTCVMVCPETYYVDDKTDDDKLELGCLIRSQTHIHQDNDGDSTQFTK